MLNVKPKTLAKLMSLLLVIFSNLSSAEFIQQLRSTSFGTILQTTGSCTMDPTTGTISGVGSLCLSPSGTLGRFTIYGDPSSTIQIKLIAGTDATNGITFYPTARFTNNVGGDTTYLITGSYAYFDTGTDGRINVWIGGTMDLSQSLSASTTYTLDWDFEYTQQ